MEQRFTSNATEIPPFRERKRHRSCQSTDPHCLCSLAMHRRVVVHHNHLISNPTFFGSQVHNQERPLKRCHLLPLCRWAELLGLESRAQRAPAVQLAAAGLCHRPAYVCSSGVCPGCLPPPPPSRRGGSQKRSSGTFSWRPLTAVKPKLIQLPPTVQGGGEWAGWHT